MTHRAFKSNTLTAISFKVNNFLAACFSLKILNYLYAMRQFLLILVASICWIAPAQAQLKVVKKPGKKYANANYSFGYGRARSVLYTNRNVKANNDARGHHFTFLYGSSSRYRFCAEYTHYTLKDIAPTWYNVKANVFEVNVHYMARISGSKSYFFPIVGLSYNVFKGYFTGKNDFLNLEAVYGSNKSVVSRWTGLNVGTGFEIYRKPFSIYGDYKMRVGVSAGTEPVNVQDVCFTIGIRYTFRRPIIGKIFQGTRKRYFLNEQSEGNEWY